MADKRTWISVPEADWNTFDEFATKQHVGVGLFLIQAARYVLGLKDTAPQNLPYSVFPINQDKQPAPTPEPDQPTAPDPTPEPEPKPQPKKMVPSNRVCPECGSDVWQARNHHRTVEENFRLRQWIESDAAKHAVQVARLKLQVMEATESQRGLQRKKDRQSRVIRRLEDRLRERGQRPYEHVVRPDHTHEGVPLPDEPARLRAWIDGLYGHGQISDRLYKLIINTGQWPKEQGDTPG